MTVTTQVVIASPSIPEDKLRKAITKPQAGDCFAAKNAPLKLARKPRPRGDSVGTSVARGEQVQSRPRTGLGALHKAHPFGYPFAPLRASAQGRPRAAVRLSSRRSPGDGAQSLSLRWWSPNRSA